MINKRHVHHVWTRVRGLKPVYFLILTAVFGIISVFSLRQNNLQMIKLREQVYKVDEQNGDIETALRALREYVYAHMNTDLSAGHNTTEPPIQLKYRYERLVAVANAQTEARNSKVYTDAQADCERQFPAGLSGSGRIPCIQAYVDSHNTQAGPAIPDSLYKFNFVSPRWSPDLAGWSLVAAGLSGFLFATLALIDRWFHHTLHD